MGTGGTARSTNPPLIIAVYAPLSKCSTFSILIVSYSSCSFVDRNKVGKVMCAAHNGRKSLKWCSLGCMVSLTAGRSTSITTGPMQLQQLYGDIVDRAAVNTVIIINCSNRKRPYFSIAHHRHDQ